jgi:hypothetical protein
LTFMSEKYRFPRISFLNIFCWLLSSTICCFLHNNKYYSMVVKFSHFVNIFQASSKNCRLTADKCKYSVLH